MTKHHVTAIARLEYEYDKVIDAADAYEAAEIAERDALAEGVCEDSDVEILSVDLEEDV